VSTRTSGHLRLREVATGLSVRSGARRGPRAREYATPTPIQEEPESTIGRKPDRFPHEAPRESAPSRSGASVRREEGDEGEHAGEIREREQDQRSPAGETGE
jgi:hypothetical protein